MTGEPRCCRLPVNNENACISARIVELESIPIPMQRVVNVKNTLKTVRFAAGRIAYVSPWSQIPMPSRSRPSPKARC
jgi:hypothetical protein